MQKGLIEWRESRGTWARRLVPKRAEARWEQITQPRTLSNPSADAALTGVHGVGASHTTPVSQVIRRLVLLPLEPAPFLSNLFACGIRGPAQFSTRAACDPSIDKSFDDGMLEPSADYLRLDAAEVGVGGDVEG